LRFAYKNAICIVKTNSYVFFKKESVLLM